jgi:hypothetical protein
MPDGRLVFDDGEVRLGAEILPGVLVSQTINGVVRFDQAEQDGMSGKAKIPMGWEDAGITLTVVLLTDAISDCYDKLTAVNRIFKGADNGANPRVYTVTGRHLRSRRIGQVVFAGLDSEEDDQSDVIRATLNFVEHRPVITETETRVSAGGHAETGTAPAVAATEPAADPKILADDDSPFAAGYTAGVG